MRVIATGVCVCVFVTTVSHAKTVESVEMPFGEADSGGSRNHVYCRHLANTIE